MYKFLATLLVEVSPTSLPIAQLLHLLFIALIYVARRQPTRRFDVVVVDDGDSTNDEVRGAGVGNLETDLYILNSILLRLFDRIFQIKLKIGL